jgi:hypothetical protein
VTTTPWDTIRVELQHEVMGKLGADWIVAYLWHNDTIVLINTRTATGALFFTREEIEDNIHKTDELRRRLSTIATER